MRAAVSIYLGQATGAAIGAFLVPDPFYWKLALFSACVAAINVVFILVKWAFGRLA